MCKQVGLCYLHLLLGGFPSLVYSKFNMLAFAYLISSHLISYFTIIPQKPVCFVMRERKGVDPEGRAGAEELGGAEGEDSVMRYIA